MDFARTTGEGMAAIYFRAEDLARRTVEYHRVREAEHRSRERFGRRFRPFPWSEAAAAVLSDEALEDEASVVALIKELGRQGCSEVALAALDLVVTRGSPAPTKPMFDAAIRVCATEYQDQRCLDQFLRMRSLGLTVDLGTANLVLTGLCCRGRLEAAVELLGEMRGQLGLRPNTYSVLMVLQACNFKRRGAYREAIDAVQALEAGGRTANEEVVEALLQVCEAAMHRAPSFEAARAVFAALSELHLADSTRVYNGLLGAAGRAGRWREAQMLYGQMQEDEVPASLETHTALIQACVVGRALDHALHIFEHLVAGRSAHEAVPASIATYNHLIHACHQAGMLEKALEIASWVQKTGVQFDDETYGELMATIDVAQLWDDKAMKQARQHQKPVLPGNLRPAPYDAMRVMYLDHLESLQQEELLALEKLGGLGGWASKSLTRGSVASPWGGGPGAGSGRGSTPQGPPPGGAMATSSLFTPSSRSLARAATAPSTSALSGGSANGSDAESVYGHVYSFPYGTASGRGNMLAASVPLPPGGVVGPWAGALAAGPVGPDRSGASTRSVSPAPPAGTLTPGSHLHGYHPNGAALPASLANGGGGGIPHAWTASSSKSLSLLKSTSSRGPLGGGAGSGQSVGGMSFRSPGAASAPTAAPPTGFHEPPTWAQLQTLDAVTAGPGGTPFSAAAAAAAAAAVAAAAQGAYGASGDGADPFATAAAAASAVPLTLTVEPSNPLYGQSSSASLAGVGTSRTSMRSLTTGHTSAAAVGGGGGGGGGVTAVPRVAGLATGNGTLPPLGGDAMLGGGMIPAVAVTSAVQSLVLGSQNSPRAPLAAGVGGVGGPGRQRSRAAGGLLAHAAAGAAGVGGAADGGVAAAALAGDFVPSPLPVLSSMSSVSVPAGGPSRRYMATVMGK